MNGKILYALCQAQSSHYANLDCNPQQPIPIVMMASRQMMSQEKLNVALLRVDEK